MDWDLSTRQPSSMALLSHQQPLHPFVKDVLCEEAQCVKDDRLRWVTGTIIVNNLPGNTRLKILSIVHYTIVSYNNIVIEYSTILQYSCY